MTILQSKKQNKKHLYLYHPILYIHDSLVVFFTEFMVFYIQYFEAHSLSRLALLQAQAKPNFSLVTP